MADQFKSPSDNLRIVGSDLQFSMPIIKQNNTVVNATAPQTLQISVKRLTDNKWWNGSSWAVSETLLSCVEDGTSGMYLYTLTSGYIQGEALYRVRLKAVGVVNTDYSIEFNLVPKADMVAVDGDYVQATKLKYGLRGTTYGEVVSWGSTDTNQFKAKIYDPVTGLEAGSGNDDNYKNRVITFIEGVNGKPSDESESVLIQNYNQSLKVFTTSDMINAPSVGDEFVIT